MKVYLAYSENFHQLLVDSHARLIVSFGRAHRLPLGQYLPGGFSDYMLDSGGYQLAVGTAERAVNVDHYCLWAHLVMESHGDKVRAIIGLDTKDWYESLSNYQKMKREGLIVVPVWKAFWPVEVLEHLCSEYDYIAMGGVAFSVSKETLRSVWERVIVKYPYVKIHMLGVGIRGTIAFKTFRPYSVDVSTWSVPARFGHDLVPDKKQIMKEVKLPDHLRQRLRDDKNYEFEMVGKAIKIIQSLEYVLDDLHEPHQIQMEV